MLYFTTKNRIFPNETLKSTRKINIRNPAAKIRHRPRRKNSVARKKLCSKINNAPGAGAKLAGGGI